MKTIKTIKIYKNDSYSNRKNTYEIHTSETIISPRGETIPFIVKCNSLKQLNNVIRSLKMENKKINNKLEIIDKHKILCD